MIRVKWLKRRCEVCFGLFDTSRSDAKICSPKCRLRAHRKRLVNQQRPRTGGAAGPRDGAFSFVVQREKAGEWILHLDTTNIILARIACRELKRMGQTARVIDQEGRKVYPFEKPDDDQADDDQASAGNAFDQIIYRSIVLSGGVPSPSGDQPAPIGARPDTPAERKPFPRPKDR